MVLIDPLVNRLLKRGTLTVVFADGTQTVYGPGGGCHVTVKLHDRRVPFDLVRNPRLALGEAYMDGRLSVEDGTLLDLLRLVVGANPWEGGGNGRKVLGRGKSVFRNLWRRNPAKRARRNVAHHYDLGNELYELFLDSDLQYSCAYFKDPASTLERAQLEKKAHIASKLHLSRGQRVLDIGCGWGGTALYLNRVAGVEVLGITLSQEQLERARARAEEAGVSDQVRFELVDYRKVSGRFDRIVSIGMFEHVGAAHYAEFFGKCRELLTDDGVMLLHTIGKYGKAAAPDPFTDKYIFPGYHIPSLSQMSSASEKVRLITTDVETLRIHYAYTLLHWLERTKSSRTQIEILYDERFYRLWEFYLSGGVVAFENGSLCNYQVQYVRNRNALPVTRDYMAKEEAQYVQAQE